MSGCACKSVADWSGSSVKLSMHLARIAQCLQFPSKYHLRGVVGQVVPVVLVLSDPALVSRPLCVQPHDRLQRWVGQLGPQLLCCGLAHCLRLLIVVQQQVILGVRACSMALLSEHKTEKAENTSAGMLEKHSFALHQSHWRLMLPASEPLSLDCQEYYCWDAHLLMTTGLPEVTFPQPKASHENVRLRDSRTAVKTMSL